MKLKLQFSGQLMGRVDTFEKNLILGPSNNLILFRPLLLPSSVFLSISLFSNDSVFHIRWPKYWSFSFSVSPSNEYSGLISFRVTGWISLLSKGLSRVFSNTTVQKHQFFSTQPFLCPTLTSVHDYWKNTYTKMICLSEIQTKLNIQHIF